MKKLLAVAAVLASGFMAVPAAACPDWQYSGRSNLGTLGGQFLYTPRYWSVVAGGNVNLANCAAPGTPSVNKPAPILSAPRAASRAAPV